MENEVEPDYFYKYRSLHERESSESGALTQTKERLRKTIVEGKVWFASPSTFNDPLDCMVVFRSRGVTISNLEVSESLHRRKGMKKSLSEQRLSRRRGDLENTLTGPEDLAGLEEKMQTKIYGTGIYSVSAVNDSPAMWAYYADNHRGLCLWFRNLWPQFDEEITSKCAHPVEYKDDFPAVDLLEDDSELAVNKVLLTKSSDWCHEKEWRYIDFRGGNLKTAKGRALAGVIFGARMCQRDKDEVLSWVKESSFNLRLWQAEISSSSYRLLIKEIPWSR